LLVSSVSDLRISRVFGILSIVFLIVGGLTVILPLISAVGLRVSAGAVILNLGGGSATVPLYLTNYGFLSFSVQKFAVTLLGSDGSVVGSGSSEPVSIAPGGESTINVTVSKQGGASLASAVTIRANVSTNIGGFFPVSSVFMLPFQLGSGFSVPSARTPIEHVVVMMMENHAFDNIFGVYPTNNESTSDPIVSQIQTPTNLLSLSQVPPSLTAIPPSTFSTPDVPHDLDNETAAWDNGNMDGFLSHMGDYSLTYFNSSQMSTEWNLAEEYGLADQYFQPVLGATVPNRLAALSGHIPSESYSENLDSSDLITYAGESIFAEVEANGLSWGYYSEGGAGAMAPLLNSTQVPLNTASLGSVDDFFNQLSNGTMPAVSWIDPYTWTGGYSGENIMDSQHPPYNVSNGEVWMLNIVNHVENSQYWNSSAIFITYDEGGGYYDQVAPPRLDGNQLGFRVPLIVISPYAKEGYVSHTVLTHLSIPAFIDYDWKLPALSQLVLDSNLPLDFFNFNTAYQDGKVARASMTIDPSSQFPLSLQLPFSQLPYQRQGSSSQTLAQQGASVWQGPS
jgi:phospholipase C